MYRTGHYGVSLLLYAPVLAALLVVGRPTAALAGALGMLVLTMVPDYDQRVPFVSHRGSTHTLAFAWLVGAALGGSFLLVPGLPPSTRYALAGFGLFIGVLGITAHLVADVLTPSGVALLWPFSSKRYSLGLVSASNVLANYLLFALGVLATAAVATTVPI